MPSDGRVLPNGAEIHFTDVHRTVSGRMQFVDPDDTDRWITTDTVAEVTR
jgi:hypothetical protein